MKVLHVIASMNPTYGGPCQGIRNTVPVLEKLGIDNEVVSLDSASSDFVRQDSFVIHALGPARGPWSYSAALIPWLTKNLDRFDAVIVHGLWLYYGYAVNKVVRQLKQKQSSGQLNDASIPNVFVMPHGMLDPYFQKAKSRRLKAKRNWAYWKLIEGSLINKAEGVLFTCQEELVLARKTFHPYKPKKEFNVGYGIAAPPSYNPQMQQAFQERCPEVSNSPYLLFLSRIHEKKGVDLILQAYIKLIGSQFKSTKALQETGRNEVPIPKLIVAGPGMETKYGLQLQQTVAKNPYLKSYIFFPGMLSGDAKWGAYYGCEAFILPSHQENFGIAVVEALACKKPVLISNKINIWNEISSDEAGIIAEDSIDGAIELLKNWFRLSQAQKQMMSDKAAECYSKHFAIGSAARQLKAVLVNQPVVRN